MRRVVQASSAALLFLTGTSSHGQVVVEGDEWHGTIEGWSNATWGRCFDQSAEVCGDRDGRIDAALRGLARTRFDDGPNVGLRIVAESTPEDRFDLTEASVIAFGVGGRFEFGDRQGLPDVLTGYAPNSFTFTSADFGPASGASLDPGGGLQPAFLSTAASAVVRELGALGFAATLFDDRSTKALYVAPKIRGWLAGVSYAAEVDDPRFAELLQTGLVYEAYFGQHVLRAGGSWSHARGAATYSDLDSVNLGITWILEDSLTIGLSGTSNGSTGPDATGAHRSSAHGVVASVNYNDGPWTFGGFYQVARSEGDATRVGRDRLEALELGVSWRWSTRVRIYGAWYHASIEDEGLREPDADVLLMGVRVTL